MEEQARIDQLAAALAQTLGAPPEVAVVLGSGWKERAADLIDLEREIQTVELPGWPQPRVAGHGGELALGMVAGRRTVLCGGRVHSYEGYQARDLVRGVRAMAAWGCPNLLLLNAAGSVTLRLQPGSLAVFTDHINYSLPSPLRGDQTPDGKSPFVDLVDLYEPSWRAALLEAAPGCSSGVYAGMSGPNYETPAEIQMLERLGADMVGMSTIPEAIAAKAAGMQVLAISLITNLGAGLSGSRPNHAEVLDTAAEHGANAGNLLAEAVRLAPR